MSSGIASVPMPAYDTDSSYRASNTVTSKGLDIEESVSGQISVQDRMVAKDSNISLLVKDVKQTANEILTYTLENGGFMVNSSVTNPEKQANGQLVIRIPAEKLDATMEFLTRKAIKVASQNTTGTDITDQYQDNQARLDILQANLARFEEIMDKATTTDQILNVQREIFSLQDQIDAIKGQQKYMDETSKYARIVIFLSTDELSLPYAPDQVWRPEAVLKNAVRSLILVLRSIASIVIWLGVFSVIIVPVVLLVRFISKKLSK
ncbi:DUF4349 domain-containing protein [Candidatus Beckwithbacteria bacterium]|nr:DUF4349 domain-containing protein [Candidatus Beckwithbacteria bacterium]